MYIIWHLCLNDVLYLSWLHSKFINELYEEKKTMLQQFVRYCINKFRQKWDMAIAFKGCILFGSMDDMVDQDPAAIYIWLWWSYFWLPSLGKLFPEIFWMESISISFYFETDRGHKGLVNNGMIPHSLCVIAKDERYHGLSLILIGMQWTIGWKIAEFHVC